MRQLILTSLALLLMGPATGLLPGGGGPSAPRGLTLTAVAEAAPSSRTQQGPTVWGIIKRYTDAHIVVDGKRYKYRNDVIIDTYSLEKDKRGNVRLTLDENGRVKEVFFYGIDMPDVIRRYKM